MVPEKGEDWKIDIPINWLTPFAHVSYYELASLFTIRQFGDDPGSSCTNFLQV